MSSTDRLRFGLLMSLALVAADASAQAVGESPLGNSVERQLSTEQTFSLWARDPARVKTEAGDRLEKHGGLAETFTGSARTILPRAGRSTGASRSRSGTTSPKRATPTTRCWCGSRSSS